MSKKASINPDEYSEILRKAIAEIQTARNVLAKQLANTANSVYWGL